MHHYSDDKIDYFYFFLIAGHYLRVDSESFLVILSFILKKGSIKFYLWLFIIKYNRLYQYVIVLIKKLVFFFFFWMV